MWHFLINVFLWQYANCTIVTGSWRTAPLRRHTSIFCVARSLCRSASRWSSWRPNHCCVTQRPDPPSMRWLMALISDGNSFCIYMVYTCIPSRLFPTGVSKLHEPCTRNVADKNLCRLYEVLLFIYLNQANMTPILHTLKINLHIINILIRLRSVKFGK